jgi:hypothetical protein
VTVQSIAFRYDLLPLERPSSQTSVHAELKLVGTSLVFECVLRSASLKERGLDAFVWEEGDAPFCETLWKKSCFEFFLADAHTARYWEWNFSPKLRWGAFSFDQIRSRCPREARREAGYPDIAVDESRLQDGELALRATVDLCFSPYLHWLASTGKFDEQLLVSLNAITETSTGERIHWALRHEPEGKPNFHVKEHFMEFGS